MTLPELTPILGIFAGMLGGFYAISKSMIKSSQEERKADRDERKELSAAIGEMAKSMQKVADSNKRIADESKQRNGHLAEIAVENKQQIMDRLDGIIINKQTVHQQVVENETVKKKG